MHLSKITQYFAQESEFPDEWSSIPHKKSYLSTNYTVWRIGKFIYPRIAQYCAQESAFAYE